MSLCCVDGCRVGTDEDDDEITYFQFPINRSLKKKWAEAIGSTSTKVGVNSVVCSQHFRSQDYEEYRGGRRLKSLVVPSVFRQDSSEESCSSESEADAPPDKPTAQSKKETDRTRAKEKKHPDVQDKRQTRSNTNHDRQTEEGDGDNKEESVEREANKSTAKTPVDNVAKVKKHRKRRKIVRDVSSSDSDDDYVSANRRRPTQNSRKKRPSPTNNHATKKPELAAKTENGDQSVTESDKTATKSDKTSTKSDKTATKSDKTATKSDKTSTKSDKTNTKSDKTATKSDKTATISDKTNTKSDKTVAETNKVVDSDKSDKVSTGVTQKPQQEANKPEDIEELLTNYHIQTNNTLPCEVLEGAQAGDCIDLDSYKEEPPVFIEVPVDKGVSGGEGPAAGGSDCLMLLESVQCEVDPEALMLPDLEPPPEHTNTRAEAISLLTSSDSDEVVIQERHIDTVEVSDEDEDDVPLLNLVRPKAEELLQRNLDKLMWGVVDYYCYRCKYTTVHHSEYEAHVRGACSVAIHVCPSCNYTTASKVQFARHKRKHKEERRYRCHICNYNARHNMSLIYHLKSHEATRLRRVKNGFKCDKCGFISDVKLKVLRHVRLCMSGRGRHRCDQCNYETARANDFKRHLARKHACKDEAAL